MRAACGSSMASAQHRCYIVAGAASAAASINKSAAPSQAEHQSAHRKQGEIGRFAEFGDHDIVDRELGAVDAPAVIGIGRLADGTSGEVDGVDVGEVERE